jgi:hypothetical protein
MTTPQTNPSFSEEAETILDDTFRKTLRIDLDLDVPDVVEALTALHDRLVEAARLDESLKYPQPLYEQGMRDGRREELLEIGLLAHKFEGEDYHCREIADAIDERLRDGENNDKT